MKAFEQYTDLEVVQKIVAGEVELFEIIIRRNNPFYTRWDVRTTTTTKTRKI